MEILMPIVKVFVFVGWMGVFEMLATVSEERNKQGRVTRELRVMLYMAAVLAFCLLNIAVELFGFL